MSCGVGRPPSLGIVACIAPAPGPTNKMPLITTMLRSFRKTVSRGDLQALGGRTCLYLCAYAPGARSRCTASSSDTQSQYYRRSGLLLSLNLIIPLVR